jgi:hypothetical protein
MEDGSATAFGPVSVETLHDCEKTEDGEGKSRPMDEGGSLMLKDGEKGPSNGD